MEKTPSIPLNITAVLASVVATLSVIFRLNGEGGDANVDETFTLANFAIESALMLFGQGRVIWLQWKEWANRKNA